MEVIVKFFRDTLSGFEYVVYALILLFFIFAIIGYFVTQKYVGKDTQLKKKIVIEKNHNDKISIPKVNTK